MSSGRQQQQQHNQSPSTAGGSATSVSHQPRTGTPTLTLGDWVIGHKYFPSQDRSFFCIFEWWWTKLTGSLQISTVTGQVHTGAVLIYDPHSQIVVLSSQTRSVNGGVDVTPSNSLFDIQIIKVGSIKDIHRLPTKQDGFKPFEAKPITVQDMKNREEIAHQRAQEEERRLGVGVTLEGQKIYEAFAKTYSPSLPKTC
jgi:Anticodon-binding domain